MWGSRPPPVKSNKSFSYADSGAPFLFVPPKPNENGHFFSFPHVPAGRSSLSLSLSLSKKNTKPFYIAVGNTDLMS